MPSPRGLVSGATKIRPSSAQAARYSPFSVTLACVQVRPDKYQTTGSFPICPACGGRNTEKAISHRQALDSCFTTSCRPPWDLFSETTSIALPFVMLNLFQHPLWRRKQPFTKIDPETSSG